MIRFENVGKCYDDGPDVLREISFKLDAGSFHFLTGSSGAGKSSVSKQIRMSERRSRGLIWRFDKEVSNLPRGALLPLRRHISVIFQDFRLISRLSTFDSGALPLRLAGESDVKVEKTVTDLLDLGRTWRPHRCRRANRQC